MWRLEYGTETETVELVAVYVRGQILDHTRLFRAAYPFPGSRIKAMALSGAFAMRVAEKASSDLMYRLHECEVLQRLPGKISSPRSLEEIYKREAISSKVIVGEDYA